MPARIVPEPDPITEWIRRIMLLRQMGPNVIPGAYGVPIVQGNLPSDVLAATPMWGRPRIEVGEAGLPPEILVHEMEHLRQRRQWGPLAPLAAGGSYLAAMLRGQDPTVFSGWEYPAYEQQARSLARQRAEVAARRGR